MGKLSHLTRDINAHFFTAITTQYQYTKVRLVTDEKLSQYCFSSI